MALPLPGDHQGIPGDKDSLSTVEKVLGEEYGYPSAGSIVRPRHGRRGEKLPVRKHGSPSPDVSIRPVGFLEESNPPTRSGGDKGVAFLSIVAGVGFDEPGGIPYGASRGGRAARAIMCLCIRSPTVRPSQSEPQVGK